MIVAFFGHSEYCASEGDEGKVIAILEEVVGELPCELFLGEYGGFDRFAYRCAQKYKQTHPNARVVFVTPYPLPRGNGMAAVRFDAVLYPAIEHVPKRYAIVHRNKWIAEHADVFIGYVRHRFGGAYRMYRQVKALKKVIYNIAPAPLSVL